MQLVAHQRRPGMAVDDLFDRAAEIDVDEAGPRSALSLAASAITRGSQPASWTAIGCSSGQLAPSSRIARRADRRLARDHLGDDERGAVLFDDAAERQIGHPDIGARMTGSASATEPREMPTIYSIQRNA